MLVLSAHFPATTVIELCVLLTSSCHSDTTLWESWQEYAYILSRFFITASTHHHLVAYNNPHSGRPTHKAPLAYINLVKGLANPFVASLFIKPWKWVKDNNSYKASVEAFNLQAPHDRLFPDTYMRIRIYCTDNAIMRAVSINKLHKRPVYYITAGKHIFSRTVLQQYERCSLNCNWLGFRTAAMLLIMGEDRFGL